MCGRVTWKLKEPYKRDYILQKRPMILLELKSDCMCGRVTWKWFICVVVWQARDSYVWLCDTKMIYMCGRVTRKRFICVVVWNDSFICAMRHVAHMNESRRTYERVMSHVWMMYVTHMNESCHTYEWVMSHICMSHVTHMNESRDTQKCVTSHIWISHVTRLIESYGWGLPQRQAVLSARSSTWSSVDLDPTASALFLFTSVHKKNTSHY